MTPHGSLFRTAAARGIVFALAAASVALAGIAATPRAAHAAKHAPFAAHSGLVCAEAAARVWAADAALVYLENDEDLGPNGAAPRWGYLYYSAELQKARGYSVRDGRIVAAEDLGMKFESPPVSPEWIDSQAALAAADEHGGRDYCRLHSGRVGTMLLSRGTFQDGKPDLTTWTIVYVSEAAPSLFVVVDAAQARVCRTWRG